MWVLASSRPDLIEVDLKRPGRIDVKIPLFPTRDRAKASRCCGALCKRQGLAVPEERFPMFEAKIPQMLTPGAAEALAVKAYRLSRTRGLDATAALRRCLEGYQLPVPPDVMEFQIGLAVREASDLEFVPEKVPFPREPGSAGGKSEPRQLGQ